MLLDLGTKIRVKRAAANISQRALVKRGTFVQKLPSALSYNLLYLLAS